MPMNILVIIFIYRHRSQKKLVNIVIDKVLLSIQFNLLKYPLWYGTKEEPSIIPHPIIVN